MSNRSTLKSFFSTGLRPTQAQFADLIDSAASLAETNTGNLMLTGGIVIGNTGTTVAGTIKWTGTNFEFHNGVGFQVLNFAGPAIPNPLVIGNGTIGNLPVPNLVGFAHTARFDASQAAISQTQGGLTFISSSNVGSIILRNSTSSPNLTALTAQNGVVTVHNQLIIGNPAVAPAIPPNTLLAVVGEAQKFTGLVWQVMSDVRVKKDIADFDEGLEKLIKIKPVRFKYKGLDTIESGNEEQVGVLAHEVRDVFPYMVKQSNGKVPGIETEEENLLSFNGSALLYVIVNAIKELNTRLGKIEQLLSKDQN